jgi:hypothetical protein
MLKAFRQDNRIYRITAQSTPLNESIKQIESDTENDLQCKGF